MYVFVEEAKAAAVVEAELSTDDERGEVGCEGSVM